MDERLVLGPDAAGAGNRRRDAFSNWRPSPLGGADTAGVRPSLLSQSTAAATEKGRHARHRRALDEAKKRAGRAATEGRLSMHALRHSYCSALATAGLSPTTLARITGHSDPGFTLRACARDGRDEDALVADVLARALPRGSAMSSVVKSRRRRRRRSDSQPFSQPCVSVGGVPPSPPQTRTYAFMPNGATRRVSRRHGRTLSS